jgi:repressor LexA
MSATNLHNLTPRQADAFNCIVKYIDQNGYSPTVRDIQVMLGLKSPNPAYQLLSQLRRKGAIEWEPGTTRTIRIKGSYVP